MVGDEVEAFTIIPELRVDMLHIPEYRDRPDFARRYLDHGKLETVVCEQLKIGGRTPIARKSDVASIR